jgi:hypothetical protein
MSSPTVRRALNGMRDWASPLLHPWPKNLHALTALLDDANQQVRRKKLEDTIDAELRFRGLSADQMLAAKEFAVRDPLYFDTVYQKPLLSDYKSLIPIARSMIARYFEALL